uniref:Uncharacterized protein n=1 Tax=Astyanax mexicanus TaxID=7994 RepID=A0A8B9LWF0_ASTMX
MRSGKQSEVSLPKHSYWFDFWTFLLFDIVFFLFMYFICTACIIVYIFWAFKITQHTHKKNYQPGFKSGFSNS